MLPGCTFFFVLSLSLLIGKLRAFVCQGSSRAISAPSPPVLPPPASVLPSRPPRPSASPPRPSASSFCLSPSSSFCLVLLPLLLAKNCNPRPARTFPIDTANRAACRGSHPQGRQIRMADALDRCGQAGKRASGQAGTMHHGTMMMHHDDAPWHDDAAHRVPPPRRSPRGTRLPTLSRQHASAHSGGESAPRLRKRTHRKTPAR